MSHLIQPSHLVSWHHRLLNAVTPATCKCSCCHLLLMRLLRLLLLLCAMWLLHGLLLAGACCAIAYMPPCRVVLLALMVALSLVLSISAYISFPLGLQQLPGLQNESSKTPACGF